MDFPVFSRKDVDPKNLTITRLRFLAYLISTDRFYQDTQVLTEKFLIRYSPIRLLYYLNSEYKTQLGSLKATAAASRKTKLQKEQCGRLSVLQLFHVGFTALPRMVFMKRQRMKYLLPLWSKLQICKIQHRHLVNYVKEMYLNACCKCGTIIFRHSIIGDTDF